jgi:hypothetical protein
MLTDFLMISQGHIGKNLIQPVKKLFLLSPLFFRVIFYFEAPER